MERLTSDELTGLRWYAVQLCSVAIFITLVSLGCRSTVHRELRIIKESYAIKGQVVGHQNQPMKDALICLSIHDGIADTDVVSVTSNVYGIYEILTDNDGMSLPKGTYIIRVSKLGFSSAEKTVFYDGTSLFLSKPIELNRLKGPELVPVHLPSDGTSTDRLHGPVSGPVRGN